MCSGQHSVFLLLCKLRGWSTDNYWLEEHPAQVAYREVVARAIRDLRAAGVIERHPNGVTIADLDRLLLAAEIHD